MNQIAEPNREAARLRALREHAITDTGPEPYFDDLVRRIATLCRMPIALLTFVDEQRQWFKARVGFPLRELPRSIGFDAITILQSTPLVISDASQDTRYSHDPLVLSEFNIRFYAGVPLMTDDGHAIGALSVMDRTARVLSVAQFDALTEAARQVMSVLSQRRVREWTVLREQTSSHVADVSNVEVALHRAAENLASLAHELRTPLNSVVGLTTLLLSTPLDPAQRELCEMTLSSARALTQLVNDMPTALKSASGDAEPALVSFDVRTIVEDVGSALAPKAHEKGLDLIVRCSPRLPRRLIGDAGRIRQILTNLIDNAIKFTADGHVLIDADADDPIDGKVLLSINVEDTGVGIAPEQQSAVFDRYVQVDGAQERVSTGSGLGLAISRTYAERMGGAITLRSQPDQGSLFRFAVRLPVDLESVATELSGQMFPGLRVLIAGGPKLQQQAVRELMRDWGGRVSLCSTIGETLDAALTGHDNGDPFDVVLMDERMIVGNGGGMLRAILATSALKNTRLVILTAAARGSDADQLITERLVWSITKPVRRRPLMEILTRAARELPRLRMASSQSGAMPPTRVKAQDTDSAGAAVSWLPPTQWSAEILTAPGIDEESGGEEGDPRHALVIEDDIVNQRLSQMMLQQLGFIVDVASNGHEGVALFETRVYDLVLVDCKMDGVDGYETTAMLRRMEAGHRHTTIVAVTADTSPGVRERCLAAGMDAYIAKPVHADTLRNEIQTLLRKAAPIDEALDRTALIARVAGNREVLRSLASLCEAECARQLGAIRAAIADGDRQAFLRAAHKLRGTIMSLEARAAVDAVQRLEQTASDGKPADAEALLEPLKQELDRLLSAMNALLVELSNTDRT